MTNRSDFNVAAGVHSSVLNRIVSEVYEVLYPDFCQGILDKLEDAQKIGLASIEYDIQAPPAINLAPSKIASDHIATTLRSSSQAESVSDASLKRASAATFSAVFPKIKIKVNYESGADSITIADTSLEVHATFKIDEKSSNPRLKLKILKGAISVPSEPILNSILNNTLVPFLIKELNQKVLRAIKISPLKLKNVTLGVPVVAVQRGYLTLYTALGSSPRNIPSLQQWPKDAVYIAADIATIKKAVGHFFPLGPRDSFKWEIFSGYAGATVEMPDIIRIDSSGIIHVKLTAEARAQLTVKLTWPMDNISIGPRATATWEVALLPKVENGKLVLFNHTSKNPSFDWSWLDLPSWVEWIVFPLAKGLRLALSAMVGPMVGDAVRLALREIPICDISKFDIDFKNDTGKHSKISVSLDNASASGIDNSLLVAALKATVSKS